MGKRVTNATATAVAAIETAASGLKAAMPAEFPRLLYGRSVAEDLEALPPALLARAAAAAYEHLTGPRKPETINLRFRDDEFGTDGRDHQITILEVVDDNKPFLLDSTLAELQEQGYEPRLVAHPILAVARATAEGIRQVADAIRQPGGLEATQLRVAERYVQEFGNLAQKTNTVILPANVADVASMVSTAMKVFQTAGR